MQILPAIDIKNGKALYTEFGTDPLEVAQHFVKSGASHLHIVDMNGVLESSSQNIELIKTIVKKTHALVELNAGNSNMSQLQELPLWQLVVSVSTNDDIHYVDEAISLFGKDKCTVTLSFSNPEEMTRLIQLSNECSTLGIYRFIIRNKKNDGSLSGISLPDINSFRQSVKGQIIVSGGIASRQDIAILEKEGFAGVIIGKALYSGAISL